MFRCALKDEVFWRHGNYDAFTYAAEPLAQLTVLDGTTESSDTQAKGGTYLIRTNPN